MRLLLEKKEDIKIFILYLMMNIDIPVDLPTLTELATQDEFVRQLEFYECFHELIDAGNIIESARHDGYYEITRQGRLVAHALESSLLKEIRDKSLRSATRLILYKARGDDSESSIESSGDKFILHMRLFDSYCTHMTASLTFDSKTQAERMKLAFDERAPLVYRGLLGIISGDADFLI